MTLVLMFPCNWDAAVRHVTEGLNYREIGAAPRLPRRISLVRTIALLLSLAIWSSILGVADLVEQGPKDSLPSGLFAGTARADITPPVGIAQMAGAKARQGWEALLNFMAMLSINLAVLNLLPIPALDGGHLMILSAEAVTRRSLSARQKEVLQQAGFALLLCLMVYVTFGDISRILGWFN